jgi:hypothetical protein
MKIGYPRAAWMSQSGKSRAKVVQILCNPHLGARAALAFRETQPRPRAIGPTARGTI